MTIKHLYLLPIVIFFWFPGTFIVTYIIAIERKDVAPVFLPYISDTGNFSPESCIFGQMFNVGSFLMGLAVYVRYRQVREICTTNALPDKVQKLNYHTMWLGLVASFSVSIVANFQETNLFYVHVLGAFLTFGPGTVYACLQAVVSLKIFPIVGYRSVNIARIVLCVLCVVGFTLCSLFGCLALLLYHGKDITKWHREDGGYVSHVISAVFEWITAISVITFISTYYWEFKDVELEEPKIDIKNRHMSGVKVSPKSSEDVERDGF